MPLASDCRNGERKYQGIIGLREKSRCSPDCYKREPAGVRSVSRSCLFLGNLLGRQRYGY
jgi:hypothetical protein